MQDLFETELWQGKTIAEVLGLSVDQAALEFKHQRTIFRPLEALQQVELPQLLS